MSELMLTKDKKNLFLLALQECHGVISQACNVLGFSSNTVYHWIRNDDEFQEACRITRKDYLESLLDKAEDVVEAYIDGKDKQAAQWFLSKKGADRGYGKHVTIDLQGDAFRDLEFPDEPGSVEEWEALE